MKESVKVSLVIIGLLVSSFSFPASPAYARSTEYVSLTCGGESMYPAIRDGDQVRVKICVNGSLIEVGDIIVYCTIAAIAYVPRRSGMWIGHRVIRKYRQDGEWYFETKGDNCPEPDPWEVPEHFLLGVVVQIIHKGSVESRSSDYSHRNSEKVTDPLTGIVNGLTVATGFLTGLFVGVLLGLATAKGSRFETRNT